MSEILGLADRQRREEGSGFWSSQFAPVPTRPQIVFDLLLGVVAPVLCFVFDPIVFRANFGGPALLADYQSLAYMASGLQVMVLAAWLICGHQIQWSASLVGGILLGGAGLSGVIGLAILPYSLFGLLVFIGIFGFTPFLTSFVYLRNGRRALQLRRSDLSKDVRIGGAMAGFVLALILPVSVSLAASSFVSASIDTVIFGDESSADMAADRIKYFSFLSNADLDKLVWAYAKENESSRKEELKRRYRRITGNDVNERLAILND